MQVKFGTSGLRGLAHNLIGETTVRYVSAFASHLLAIGATRQGGRICIGWDFRSSSPAIVENVKSAISHLGLQPVLCGNLPTQAVALWAMSQALPSIMVTGSHIPANRNGLKFYLPTGEITKADEAAISMGAQTAPSKTCLGDVPFYISPIDERQEAEAFFKNRYCTSFKPHCLKGLRIGVYEHSSVARDVLKSVLSDLGADVVPLGRAADFISIDTEAVSPETKLKLCKWATEQDVHAIVSADGDGDRPLITDENGTIIRGDLIGLITAQVLSARIIVTPITSNSGIEKSAAGTVVRTRVGSPHVIAGMAEQRKLGSTSVVGFEANGGFLTQTEFNLSERRLAPLPTRDSFLPIVAVLSECAKHAVRISDFVRQFNLPVAASNKLENFGIEQSHDVMKLLSSSPYTLQAFFAERGAINSANETDGLRVTLTNGDIVHLRPSGNSPEFRIYVEAETEDAADQLIAWSKNAIEAFLASLPRERLAS